MKELICIVCPKGCHLKVDEKNDYKVTGNSCSRGEAYGREELVHPVRTLTTTVILKGCDLRRLPVRTDRPVPKSKMMECMQAVKGFCVQAPVKMGDIVIRDIAGTGANLISSADAPLK